MTTYVTAEFSRAEPVVRVIPELISAGVRRDELELFSDKPLELPEGVLDRPGNTSLMAVLGAIVNGVLATAFVYYTQRDYPLVTGGMPLISPWATGVVSFELTMAGAIAGTVLAFLWQSGLLRRRKGGRPPEHKHGAIFVQVKCSEEMVTMATRRLLDAGAMDIRRQEVS